MTRCAHRLYVKSGSTIAGKFTDKTEFVANFGSDTEPLKSTPFSVGDCPTITAGATPGISGAVNPPTQTQATLAPSSKMEILAMPGAVANAQTCANAQNLANFCLLQCSAQSATVRSCQVRARAARVLSR